MPKTLTKIGNDVFTSTGFTKFVIPDSVTEVGESLLAGATSLTEIVFGSGLKKVPVSVAAETKIKTVTIPEGYVEICDDAFRQCTELTTVKLPSSLTTVGYAAFISCAKLETVNAENVEYVDRKSVV